MNRSARRNRRNSRMTRRLLRPSNVLAASSLVIGMASAVANAQEARTTVDTYQPAPRAREGFALASGEVDPHLHLNATLQLDYANDPLV